MKSLLIVVGLIAVASARPQDFVEEFLANGERVCRLNCGRPFVSQCPIIPCPRPAPPALDKNCRTPNCLVEEASWLLWPVADNETQFWQCLSVGVWAPIQRDCACGTLFDYQEQRCVHVHEWKAQCFSHPQTPRPTTCPECPTCNDDPTSPTTTENQSTPTTPTTPTTVSTQGTTRPGNNCPCICAPCVVWPCAPCPQNCPCLQ